MLSATGLLLLQQSRCQGITGERHSLATNVVHTAAPAFIREGGMCVRVVAGELLGVAGVFGRPVLSSTHPQPEHRGSLEREKGYNMPMHMAKPE